jgi:hypothetical protein
MIVHEVSYRHSDCHLHLFFYAVADGEAIAPLVSRHFAPIGGSRLLEKRLLKVGKMHWQTLCLA